MKGTLRIAGGRFKGRRLRVPAATRPTAGRTREALLATWQQRLLGARLLDLFAGSGSVAFEALSRGARQVVLVEGDRQAVELLRRASRELGVAEQVEVVAATLPGDLATLGSAVAVPFELIFADPPYRFRLYRDLLEWAGRHLTAAGQVAVEHSARVELPDRAGRLRRVASRRHGDHRLTFYAVGEQEGVRGEPAHPSTGAAETPALRDRSESRRSSREPRRAVAAVQERS